MKISRLLKEEVKGDTLPCAVAKVGINPHCNVFATAGPTQKAVFQLVDIPTTSSNVVVIRKREKVGASQASMCAMLSITPLYGDDNVYSCEVLNITDEMIETGFTKAIRKASAFC